MKSADLAAATGVGGGATEVTATISGEAGAGGAVAVYRPKFTGLVHWFHGISTLWVVL